MSRTDQEPTTSELWEHLWYDHATGGLIWKRSGKPAGAIKRRKDGKVKSIVVRLNGVLLPAHRLVWIMHYGMIADGYQIDHRDRNPLNNLVGNLRLATHSQNQQNSRHKGNVTGMKCVVPRGKRFVAKLVHQGRQVHLGTFDTAEEAHAAYAARALQLYGEFSHA